MSAAPDRVAVRRSEPESLDRTAVVAIDGDGSVIGRATLSRLYGLRAEIDLALAPTTTVALALIDALERAARSRGLVRLELDAAALADPTVQALRRWRSVIDERRGSHLYLTWPITLVDP